MSLSQRYNIRHTLLASPRPLTYKEDTKTSGGRTSSEKSTIGKWSISGYVCLWQSKEVRYCLIQSETRVRNSFSYPICYFTVLWMSNEKYDRLFRQNQDWIKIGCKIDAQAASCTINAPLDSSTGSDLGFIMIPGAQVHTTCSSKKNTIMRTSSDSWTAVRASGRRDPEAVAGSPFVDGGHLRLAWQLPQPGRDRRRRGRLPEQGARAGLARQRLHGRAQPGRHHVGDLDWGQPWPRSRFLLRHWHEGAIGIANNVLQGIVLLGSYLPDLFGSHENVFQVPVLTAVGELDGLTISFVFRLSLFSWSDREERFTFGIIFWTGSGKNPRRRKTWSECLVASLSMSSTMRTMDRFDYQQSPALNPSVLCVLPILKSSLSLTAGGKRWDPNLCHQPRYPVSDLVRGGTTPDFQTNISYFPFDQAHTRYATSVAAFITVQSEDLFTDEEVVVFFVYSPHLSS